METFKRMRYLRFLQLHCVHLTGSFEGAFEDLRWFCWDLCPLEHLPPGFHPEKLVILELTRSNIRNMWGLNVVCTMSMFLAYDNLYGIFLVFFLSVALILNVFTGF